MLLNEPPRTNYDVEFNLFGFPVRIHPAFFILPVFFAAGTGDGRMILVFAVVFFISILVHELGHALVMRFYGLRARIVLYWMGGLAIPDSGLGPSWGGVRKKGRINNLQQVWISLAGPVAGFLLAIVIALIIVGVGGKVGPHSDLGLPVFEANFVDSSIADAFYLQYLLLFGFIINVYLNLLNLAPVYPLDGGQISRELFVQMDPWNGMRSSFILSMVIAILIALYAFTHGAQFLGFFFAFMAWNNWTMMQHSGGGGYGGWRPW